jgi:hypothetical protein
MRLEAALLHEGKFAVVVQDPFEMLAFIARKELGKLAGVG